MTSIFIEGLGLSGYRSFSGSLMEIGPFAKINLFIGQNNSGKSNVLSFLNQHYGEAVKALAKANRAQPATINLKLEALDRPMSEAIPTLMLAFGVRIGGEKYHAIMEKAAAKAGDRRDFVSSRLTTFLKSEAVAHGGELSWFYFRPQGSGAPLTLDTDFVSRIREYSGLPEADWHRIWAILNDQQGGNIVEHWIPQTLVFLMRDVFDSPRANLIPAIRRIGEAGSAPDGYSGIGIIQSLAQLQHPTHDKQAHKRYFDEINSFLKAVTGNKTAPRNSS